MGAAILTLSLGRVTQICTRVAARGNANIKIQMGPKPISSDNARGNANDRCEFSFKQRIIELHNTYSLTQPWNIYNLPGYFLQQRVRCVCLIVEVMM